MHDWKEQLAVVKAHLPAVEASAAVSAPPRGRKKPKVRRERAPRSPEQATARARKELRSAVHHFNCARQNMDRAFNALTGSGSALNGSEIALADRPVEMLIARIDQMVRVLEGIE